jgi:murein L,D-transpeptidase YcbB/YkuD
LTVKIRMLASVACAALMGLSLAANAATSPALPSSTAFSDPVSAFYASRHGEPLWLRSGADSSAARELIGVLQRAALDGMPAGPALAQQAAALLNRAESGDPSALDAADRTFSNAWVQYVQALETPPAGMTYADNWVAPRRESAATILARAAAAPSLAAYVHSVSQVNPLYAQLRDAAWSTHVCSPASTAPATFRRRDATSWSIRPGRACT